MEVHTVGWRSQTKGSSRYAEALTSSQVFSSLTKGLWWKKKEEKTKKMRGNNEAQNKKENGISSSVSPYKLVGL